MQGTACATTTTDQLAPFITDLPVELLHYIFKFFTLRDGLPSVGLTCRLWRRLLLAQVTTVKLQASSSSSSSAFSSVPESLQWLSGYCPALKSIQILLSMSTVARQDEILKHMPHSVTELQFHSTVVADMVDLLNGLARLKRLTSLDLTSCKFPSARPVHHPTSGSDAAATITESSMCLPLSLKRLRLLRCLAFGWQREQVTMLLEALARHQQAPLEVLCLGSSWVQDSALSQLPLKLTKLSLSACSSITSKGLLRLALLTSLKVLDLSKLPNAVNDEVLQEVLQMLLPPISLK